MPERMIDPAGLRIRDRPSPNHDARPEGQPIDTLILHYTGMPDAAGALERLCDPGAAVSAHWLVEEDGTVWALVPEQRRAWHAGLSWWRGAAALNARSIGIEIVNPGHEHGYRPFPPAQMQAVAALCRAILARHPIPPARVLAHSDVAPARKQDPGELFDWEGLAAQGVGLWPGAAPEAARELPALGPGAPEDEATTTLRRSLRAIGYHVPAAGGHDATLAQVVAAFQRHWAPHRTDGVADGETRWRIARVAALTRA